MDEFGEGVVGGRWLVPTVVVELRERVLEDPTRLRSPCDMRETGSDTLGVVADKDLRIRVGNPEPRGEDRSTGQVAVQRVPEERPQSGGHRKARAPREACPNDSNRVSRPDLRGRSVDTDLHIRSITVRHA